MRLVFGGVQCRKEAFDKYRTESFDVFIWRMPSVKQY